jgi:leucyl/phenylalanyl-tRNA--protein transferase
VDAYIQLHRLGWAHSVEVWDHEGRLVGGLYGVSIGGLFAGESMFHDARDASKVALVHLVVVMSQGEGRLLDVQWQTPHLESLGAVVIGRDEYLTRLADALPGPDPFASAHESDSL